MKYVRDRCKYCILCIFNAKLDQVAEEIRNCKPHLELNKIFNVTF